MCTMRDTKSTHSYFRIRVIHISYVGHKSTGDKLSPKRLCFYDYKAFPI